MKVLVTGACGFVGSALAASLPPLLSEAFVTGADNLMRPGSEGNRRKLASFIHCDIRCASDVDQLPACDWVIDAAANPSVLAGVAAHGGGGSSRQLMEHNLTGMVNILEYCRRHRAGLIVLSSSRVYSIPALASLPLRVSEDSKAFVLDSSQSLPQGLTSNGIGATFATSAPVSLYGSTKLASEALALEYGIAFDFPVWINRCGVLAGPGQFGIPDQGIFAYWVNAHLRGRPLRFTGFEGSGRQVRDAMHPSDLAALIAAQIRCERTGGQRIYTAGGGPSNAMSLRQLHDWCDTSFEARPVEADPRARPYDIPWVIMDNSDARRDFGWTPSISLADNLEQIARHAELHPDWLEQSGLR